MADEPKTFTELTAEVSELKERLRFLEYTVLQHILTTDRLIVADKPGKTLTEIDGSKVTVHSILSNLFDELMKQFSQ